jgi:hypothetical protein
MTAQLLTLFSGVVLLVVFAAVGWYRRRKTRGQERPEGRE